MPLVHFEFEELPLIVDLGFEAGLVNGSADIHAHEGGEWFVDKIFLDGSRPLAPCAGFERRPVELDRGSAIYLAILDQLENGRFKDSIVDAVREALDADDVGTSPRSEFTEHSTLNRAQQGC